MDIDDDECINGNLGLLGKLSAHQLDEFVDLLGQDSLMILFNVVLLDCCFHFFRPMNLGAIQYALPWVVYDPLVSRPLRIVVHTV